MKICIYGAGAIGGTLGVRLGEQGHEVSVIARGGSLAAIQSLGLGLQRDQIVTRLPVRVAEDPQMLGVQDLVIIAVKGPALPAVAAGIAPLLGANTRVMTTMNGVPWWFLDGLPDCLPDRILRSVDPKGDLRGLIFSSKVIGGVVHMSCTSPEPGLAQWNFGNRLIVGEALGGLSDSLQSVADALSEAGFDVQQSNCIQRDIWFKLWGNMTMNPVSALTGASCDRILGNERVRDFCTDVMREAKLIGQHIACPIEQSPEERHAVTAKLGAFKTSMLQDAEAGRPLEIDALLGVVVEIAERLDIPVPNSSALLGFISLFAECRNNCATPNELSDRR